MTEEIPSIPILFSDEFKVLEWVKKQKLSEVITAKVRRIHLKSHLFQSALDFPDAYRTSNQVDRPMNYFDRVLYSMQ